MGEGVSGKQEEEVARPPKALASSAAIHRITEQDVPGCAADEARSRTDIKHPADDDGSRAVDRAAVRRDAVDRANLAFRINVPKYPAVFARISPNPPIEAAGEHHVGDRGDGGRLRGAAAGNLAATGGRRPPDFFSGIELQRHETPASLGVQEKRPARTVRNGLRARGSRRND